jgi:hypothetical protein
MTQQRFESTAPRRVLFWRLFMQVWLVWALVHIDLVRQVNLHPLEIRRTRHVHRSQYAGTGARDRRITSRFTGTGYR